MNQLLFEGRSLVGMVSSIVNQDDRRIALNRFDWERMYRLSDSEVSIVHEIPIISSHVSTSFNDSSQYSPNCKDS